MKDEVDPTEYRAVPWHGVLAPEGEWSGDKRRFAVDSLTHRDLPMPLTWQKVSDDGHKGNVTIAKIERVKKMNGKMHAAGHFLSTPEADENIGLIGEFGKFGVSVDADSVVFAVDDEDEEGVTFSAARVSSACVVPIPAFSSAYVALGEPPEEWEMDGEEMPDEALVASGFQFTADMLEQFKRGPGWVTNPEGTKRLWEYWVHGEGAGKVRWGVPGDFNRCRVLVGEEIGESDPSKLRFINNICAQWHHDAKGIWPGRPTAGETEKFAYEVMELDEEAAPALTVTASAGIPAPAEWFKNPGFDMGDPRLGQDKDGRWGCAVTVTDDGQVYGHAALWESCHIAYKECTVAPRSETDYAYFLTGQVPLDDGTRANTGVISVGGGHAGPNASMRAAVAHYDSTSTAVADVTVGEDQFGIWMAGRIRPGATPEQVTALMASKVSGDWRNGELVAILAVNVPGFGVPRPRVAVAGGETVSLVAAGVVDQPVQESSTGLDPEKFAAAVVHEMEQLQKRRTEMAAIAAKIRKAEISALRV